MPLGGKSGLINEAVNQHTNEQLTEAIKYMGTKEYQAQRDLTDVIPTHKRGAKKSDRADEAHFQVHSNDKKNTGEEENDDIGSDDDELEALRQARMGKIKQLTEKQAEWQAKGHGVCREIAQDDFFNAVVKEKGGSELVVVHFFHREFPRCEVIDRHLSDLAPVMMPIRFVKLNVEKCPFLVEKLRVNVLPCVVLFVNDIAVDRIVGFEGVQLSDKGDDIDQDSFKHRIEVGLRLTEDEQNY